ncbi:MAG TPA: Uma2 family endonuclease [Candidatus Binatia bacterium]|jgi:Uma2 family endonuclease|nr:Uma2 family endonuclease [Candidatus Binatia bacterium]
MSQGARPFHRYTYRDYLTLEQDSPVKHEFFSGEICAIAGGTPEHAALAMAVATALGRQLEGTPYRLFSSDLRVRVSASGLTTYPDLTVICGPLQRDPESNSTVINPTIVVEVTSASTEDYDRGEKLEHYKRIESLKGCLIVSHRTAEFELWSRASKDSWTSVRAKTGEQLDILVLSSALAVDTVYRGVFEGL